MIQALNQKTSEKMKKRKMTSSFHGIRPPQLEQPGVAALKHISYKAQILEKLLLNLSVLRAHLGQGL
jgi:hypothetical protein